MKYLVLILFLFGCSDEEQCDYYNCWNGDVVCDPTDCTEQSSNDFFIYYQSDIPIAGFQFNIENIDMISSISGGAAESSGFSVSAGSNIVIGFSLTGNTIPAGSGLLSQLEISGNFNACLSSPIVSDLSGNSVSSFVLDCNTIVVGSTVADFLNHNTSDLIAFYFFEQVLIDNQPISSDDWVAAFNGDVCVGAKKWDCTTLNCDLPVYGENSLNSLTNGYMLSGQSPSFKIYDISSDILYNAFPSDNILWQDGSFNQIEILSAE